MAQELLDPTTCSKPEWRERLLGSVGRTENGVMILPAGAGLLPSQRQWLTDRMCQLQGALEPMPAHDHGRLGAALLGMFSSFPAQALNERVAEARMAAYLQTLQRFPMWAVSKGIGFWMAREHAQPDDRHAFPPSPPQLARLVKIAMQAAYRELYECGALLEAKTDRPPPTDEQKARVEALVNGLFRAQSAGAA